MITLDGGLARWRTRLTLSLGPLCPAAATSLAQTPLHSTPSPPRLPSAPFSTTWPLSHAVNLLPDFFREGSDQEARARLVCARQDPHRRHRARLLRLPRPGKVVILGHQRRGRVWLGAERGLAAGGRLGGELKLASGRVAGTEADATHLNGQGTRGVIWEHQVAEDTQYYQDRTFFHTFPSDVSTPETLFLPPRVLATEAESMHSRFRNA